MTISVIVGGMEDFLANKTQWVYADSSHSLNTAWLLSHCTLYCLISLNLYDIDYYIIPLQNKEPTSRNLYLNSFQNALQFLYKRLWQFLLFQTFQTSTFHQNYKQFYEGQSVSNAYYFFLLKYVS